MVNDFISLSENFGNPATNIEKGIARSDEWLVEELKTVIPQLTDKELHVLIKTVASELEKLLRGNRQKCHSCKNIYH